MIPDNLREKSNEFAEELADQHSDYIKSLLEIHAVDCIDEIMFHYRSAIIHGFIHGIEWTLNQKSIGLK
jgi:hypothetical protein